MSLNQSNFAYQNLKNHFDEISNINLRNEFENDKNRFNKYSIMFDDFLFDYSKNLINDDTLDYLIKLAESCNLKENTEKMFNGEKINMTEKRAVLHTALRDFSDNPIIFDGKNIKDDINQELNKIKKFTDKIHSGKLIGFTGKKIDTFVNIGIGGSDLGPKMICQALKPFAKNNSKIYFVSNVDGTDISETLKEINPETTLFIISSKSFTTQETLTNANTAKNWFLNHAKYEDIKKHFVAISTNSNAVAEFGIDTQNMFVFWNWVGGRYSLWSAIGLSISLYLGYENFEKVLQGAYKADLHFRNTEYHKNIPVLMALIAIWYNNFFKFPSQAVVPYDEYLSRFAEYLQQMDMESNGKSVDKDMNKVNYNTGNIIWGSAGTNAQHSYFQLIHQGTQKIPVDFIAPVKSHNSKDNHHRILISNMIAQSEALMKGKNEKEVIAELKDQNYSESEIHNLLPYKIFEGNRPSNTFFIKEINPENLGTLIAFYEHKVFVQGIIWNINSFDQWGVELGKQLAKTILNELDNNNKISNHDSSTNSLINYFKKYEN